MARQEDALRAKCDRLHKERPTSAAAKVRPVFDRLIRSLSPGDVLVVVALDRAFRSSLDALTIAENLRDRGVGFEILDLQIDLNSPVGRVFYTIAAAFAEFERAILRERTKQGLAAARKRGQRLGRPSALSADTASEIRDAIATGDITIEAAAAQHGVSISTIRRRCVCSTIE